MAEPKIVFEDQDLVVIDKPAGMVVNDAKTVRDLTVQKWFASRLVKGDGEFWDKGGVVHRLDRDTSGLLVLAKTQAAYEGLKKQFLERKVKKIYIAKIEGKMPDQEGIVSLPIERNPKAWGKFTVGHDLSRTAITEWKELGGGLIELKPLTGRTHQLRVHLKHLGRPIVGDRLYGGRGADRLYLHARRLEFAHPVTGKTMKFEAKEPWI